MSNDYPNFLSDSLRESMAKIAESQSKAMASISKIDFSAMLKPFTEQMEISKKLAVSSIPKYDFSAVLNPLSEQLAQIASQQIFASGGFAMSEKLKQNLDAATLAMRNANATAITEATMALKRLDYSAVLKSLSVLDDISLEYGIGKMLENGDITEDDITQEFQAQINGVENKSVSDKSEKIKSTLKSFAIRVLFTILAILCAPVIDTAKNELIEALRINTFWQNTGIIEWIEDWFENDDNAVSEEEAKASVELPESTNVSKGKREDLVNKIAEIRSFIAKAEQDENTAQLMAYLGDLEKDVNGKKYGLVFEEHREAIDEVLENYTPVLTEDEDLFIDNGGNVNFLIEGDNLASLKLLEKTHKGKIDVIYIDPPYNTGSTDFKYNDSVVAKEDMFKHSKWTSFIKKRLIIAKSLLSENGIIFISIDENEQAALKLLCDDVFGVENYVEDIIWKNKYGAGAKTVGFISIHEHILCYSKNPIQDITSELSAEGQAAYNKMDDKYNLRGGYLTQPLMTKSLADRPNLVYDIEYNGDIISPRKQWVWSKERLLKAIENDEIVFNKQKDGTYSVRAKVYLYDENGNIRRGKPLSIMNGPFTQDGTKDIRDVFGNEDVFKFAKPTELIRYFISFGINGIVNKEAIVLDFFAGSGTTGHAVIEQNKKDNGNRKFILCTNNENNICREVTYERIKRVIDKEDYKASLKYYQVQYIPIEEKMYYEYADSLLLHIRELVELENGINFNGNAEIAIVLTDEELEEFVGGIDENNKCRKLYMGHDLLPDEEQDRILKDNEIEICIIPDYYYRDLQER